MTNVALIEFIDEAQALIKEFERGFINKDKAIIIGLNPAVRRFFKEKGISSESTLDYFDSKAHARALQKSEEIIHILEDNISIKDELGIKKTYNNSFILYVRILISYSLEMLEILDNVIRKHNANELTVCTSRNFPLNSPRLVESERYLGLLSRCYANKHNIKFRNIDIRTDSNLAVKGISWLEKILIKPIVWNYFLVMKLYRRRKSVLIGDFSYDMDFLIDDIKKSIPQHTWILFRARRKGIFAELIVSIIWLICSFIRRPIRMTGHKTSLHYAIPFWFFKEYFRPKKKRLDRDSSIKRTEGSIKNTFSKFHNVFTYKEVDFSELVLGKINTGILASIQESENDTVILYTLMKKVKPNFVISPLSRDIFFSLGEVAKILGIPSLLISHASHIKPKNRLEEIEHDHLGRSLINTEYSLVAVQSPHARDYAQHYQIESKVINTGPLLWGRSTKSRKDIYEKLIGSYQQDKKILLHAGTPKTWTGMRFHIYETLDEYIDGVKDIIEAVKTLDNTLLVIQFRPWRGLSIEDFKVFLPVSDKVFFSVGTPFRDVVSIADALISFSSTTIEEALHNKIPVLLYGGSGRYIHLPALEISNTQQPIRRSACYHVSKKELLRDAIDWVLNEHKRKKLIEEDLKGHIFSANERESLGGFINKQIYTSH